MARYHLMHIVPQPKMHGLKGYKEVIDSVAWGLQQLGHEVGYALNKFDPNAINIVFGGQLLPIGVMDQLPKNSIFYNMEQLRNLSPIKTKAEIHYYATRFEVWDYSAANTSAWQVLGAKNFKIVPIGYAPILTRIAKPAIQDIDILMYGFAGEERLKAFQSLSHAGWTIVFVCGLYGEARDNLIARSKIIVNVTLYEFAKIFEVVRISYLLANRKAVVAIKNAETAVDDDLAQAVHFTAQERLVTDCATLLERDDLRSAMEEKAYTIFAQRDIRKILHNALPAG